MSLELFRRVGFAIAATGKFGTNPTNRQGITAAVERSVPTPHANQYLLPNFLREFCADLSREAP
jgi:hypothetical protein